MSRILLILWFLTLSTCGTGQGGGQNVSPHRIRVSLSEFKDNNALIVRLTGRWQARESVRGRKWALDDLVSFSVNHGALTVDGRLLPGGCRVEPLSSGGTCTFENQRYRGTLEVNPRKTGANHLVVDCDLEDYVAGVVACESGTNFHPEALKAQAVASRTFAVLRKTVERRDPEIFDVYGSTRDQVFKGIGPIRSLHREAVRRTSGKILKYRSKVLPAFYHSTCGGHTINSAEIGLTRKWLSPLKGVPCDFCDKSRVYTWQHSLSMTEFGDLFRGRVPGLPTRVRVEDTEQGVVRQVLIDTAKGTIPIGVAEFRRLVGREVKSGRFDLSWSRDGLAIEGRGWGHGSGLCQWGGEGQARRGRSFQEILDYYYPGARLSDI